jgi:hypothetical protein
MKHATFHATVLAALLGTAGIADGTDHLQFPPRPTRPSAARPAP